MPRRPPPPRKGPRTPTSPVKPQADTPAMATARRFRTALQAVQLAAAAERAARGDELVAAAVLVLADVVDALGQTLRTAKGVVVVDPARVAELARQARSGAQ